MTASPGSARSLTGCRRAEERAVVERHDPLRVRRLRCGDAGRLVDERVLVDDAQRVVEAPLEADRGRALRAHARAAERAGDVARVDLDAVGELEQAVQAVVEVAGAFAGLDGEVGPGGVADEQRVAGQEQPGLVAARPVDDGEAGVLGPVPGRVDGAQRDLAGDDLLAVCERLERVLRLGDRVDRAPGCRARARTARVRRRGRRACASRGRRRCGRRRARPARGTARSRTRGRRRPPRLSRSRRPGRKRSRDPRPQTAGRSR